MAISILVVAAANLASAKPVAASPDYAIFPPGTRWSAIDADAATAVARARTALDRSPAPLPRLHTEGTLPGKGIRDISIAAKRDHPIALDLAIAWAVTRERPFLEQVGRYLLAWSDVYQMSFNPIDETGFDALMLATDLVAIDLPPASRVRLDAFWRAMATGYLDAMDGGPRNAHTNWQSHRIKLATLAAFRTGDPRLIARARSAFRRQIAANLRADGSTFDFEERDALHYVTYNLDPLLTAALAARAHGEDWYGYAAPSRASLSRSVAWLATYARGERTHLEFAKSRVAFDRERAAAGQDEFAPHDWKPANALNTFALATVFDPRYALLRDTLSARASRRQATWIALARATRSAQHALD